MKRESIRDNRSEERVKPRIMDYVKDDNGEEYLEIKDGKRYRTIAVTDLERQISGFRKKA